MECDECSVARFYKIIFEPRLDLQILEIPKEFIKSHGNDLSNVIYLNTPTGKVWKFNLVREKNKTLLQNGWKEFVKFYSLSHGHFLMFNYKGDSRFDVIICDKSACEIDYPICSDAIREIIPSNVMKKSIGLTKPTSLDKVKTMQKNVDAKLIIARHSHFTPEEDKKVRDYAYKCKQPLFVIKIQQSFVVKNFALGIPQEFANRYLDKKRPFKRTFNLQIDATKTRPVLIKASHTHVKITKGWKDFALENKLKVGDICIFELINKHESLFQVRVIRVDDEKIVEVQDIAPVVFKTEAEIDYPIMIKSCRESFPKKRKLNDYTKPSTPMKGVQTSMDDKLIIATNRNHKLTPQEYKRVRAYAHECEHPVFVTKMQPSFVEYIFYVGVPREFRKQHLTNLDKNQNFSHVFNLQTDSGKTWPVNMVGYNSHVKLKVGWKSFAIDNKLKVDDTCIFELINKQEFKVIILRAEDDAR